MPESLVLLAAADGIATVTLNRPDKLNALNGAVITELTAIFQGLREDDTAGAVILTGAGDRAFIAGADIGELARCGVREARENSLRGQRVADLIENLGKPVIAAINGYALGGGCEMALACTLRVASERARLGLPEVRLGILPGYGGTQRLPRLVGRGRALEILLTGDPVDAAEALRIGLVNRVVPHASLMDEARALARKILAMAPLAVRSVMEAVNKGQGTPLAEALRLETDLMSLSFGTEDAREGTAAFLEKRAPRFAGK